MCDSKALQLLAGAAASGLSRMKMTIEQHDWWAEIVKT
jgi:hypothetical protein